MLHENAGSKARGGGVWRVGWWDLRGGSIEARADVEEREVRAAGELVSHHLRSNRPSEPDFWFVHRRLNDKLEGVVDTLSDGRRVESMI